MEFRQLQTFTAVVESNSFSKAAQLLQISQPSVSLHIQQLEEELGTRLIIRTTKSFEVTSAGRKVYEYARDILRLEKRLSQDCSESAKATVHLGVTAVAAGYILPEVLPHFSENAPDVRFLIDQADPAWIAEKVASGMIDLGLTQEDPQMPATSSITATPFCHDELILITPATDKFRRLHQELSSGHPDEDSYAGEILNLLLREPFILYDVADRRSMSAGGYEHQHSSRDAVETAMEDLGVLEEDLRVTAHINDTEAAKNMVAAGLGISIVSQKAAKNDINHGHILAFHLPGEGCRRQFCLLQRSSTSPGEASDAFRRYLLNYYHVST